MHAVHGLMRGSLTSVNSPRSTLTQHTQQGRELENRAQVLGFSPKPWCTAMPGIPRSIQSLAIILSVSLILCTGVLIGAITITTANDVINLSRRSGEQGLQKCLDSGERDLRLIASRYLKEVVIRTGFEVEQFLNVPENALRDFVALASAHHPDVATSPHFINTTMREMLRTRVSVLESQGTDQVGYFVFPFSPSHPLPSPPQQPEWGGSVSFAHATEQNGVIPPNGPKPVLVLEERLANGSIGHNSSLYNMGEVDALGHLRYRDMPCDRFTNWTAGERRGLCYMSDEYMGDFWIELHQRGWRNAMQDHGVLNPANEVVFSPLVSNFMWLNIWASISFTHPLMENAYPRQGNRVGFLFANAHGEGLANIFKKTDLPLGSHLYCVGHNAWTGTTNTLMAYNKGRFSEFYKPPATAEITDPPDRVRALNILNHTHEENSTELSTIAHHGIHVFSFEGDYGSAATRTADMFELWKDETSEAHSYWTVTFPVTRGELILYVNLLVLRAGIMETIDKSNTEVRSQFLQDRKSSEDHKNRSLITMLCVTVAVVGALLVMAVIFTKLITSPLTALAEDMAKVAVMDLDSIDRSQPLSRLSEVGHMQKSFKAMLKNLTHFRDYMPQSVLLDENDAGSSPATEYLTIRERYGIKPKTKKRNVIRKKQQPFQLSDNTSNNNNSNNNNSANSINSAKDISVGHTLSSSSLSPTSTKEESLGSYCTGSNCSTPRSLCLSVSATSLASGPQVMLPGSGALQDVQTLRKKNVTIVSFNLKGWHKHMERRSNSDVVGLHADLISIIQDTVQTAKGVCDIFSGDRVLAAFNAYSIVTCHRQAATCSAYSVWERVDLHRNLPALSFAVCSGETRVGHVGCPGMKKITMMSGLVPWCIALEQFSKVHGYKGLVDHYVAADTFGVFDLKCVDGVYFKKRTTKVIKVYETTARHMVKGLGGRVGDADWMYEVASLDSSSKYVKWNQTFEYIISGEWDLALESFRGFTKSEIREVCTKGHMPQQHHQNNTTTARQRQA